MGFLRNLSAVVASAFSLGLGAAKVVLTSGTTSFDVDRPVIPRGFASAVRSITAADSPYTPGDEVLVLCDCTAGDITVNLPTLASSTSRIWQFCKTDSSANVVTLVPDGAERINGNIASYDISVPDNGVELQSCTTRWQITSTSTRESFLTTATDTYGDGSDGDVTVAGTTTLTENTYYDNLVVTGTLQPSRFLVFVRGRLSGNGTIADDGNNAAGAVAGTALASAYLGGASAGGAGSAGGSAGSNGSAAASSRSAAGTGGTSGDGGGGGISGGGQAGGSSGGATVVSVNTGSNASVFLYRNGAYDVTFTRPTGGAGGGGGGARASSTGGGGGGGGGGILIRCLVCDFTGTISVRGGNGGNAVLGAGLGAGGGGGGGGGWVTVVSDEFRQTPTIDNAGGNGGAAVGTGVAGTAGSQGPVDGAGYATFVQRIGA